MNVLEQIRTQGVFRPPQFISLGEEHVPFDDLIQKRVVEAPLLGALAADSSTAILGPRGAGKSSTLAWVIDNLPEGHLAIRVPVVAMDDPSNLGIFASVAMGAALESARVGELTLQPYQRQILDGARADETTTQSGGRKAGFNFGGGVVPAQLSAELESLRKEYTRGALAVDRLHGLGQLVDIVRFNGSRPVFIVEDTEAALGADADPAQTSRFFTSSLRALVREIDAPALIAVQDAFQESAGYRELRNDVLEINLPRLGDQAEAALRTIIDRRLLHVERSVDDLLDPAAIPFLVAFYDETQGSLRNVLQSLDSATAAALDAGDERLSARHVRAGIEDWRTR